MLLTADGRCGNCGGTVTTGGCLNAACMAGPGGYFRNGVKVAPAAGPPPVPMNDADAELAKVVAWLRDPTSFATGPYTGTPDFFADALERHAHRKETR